MHSFRPKALIQKHSGAKRRIHFQRRNRSMELLRARELPVSETLPAARHSAHPQQICRRAVALLAVSLYSECRLDQTDPLDHARALEFIRPILKAYQAEEVFSPKEKAYLDNPNSTQNEQIQFAWQYEKFVDDGVGAGPDG